MPSRLLLFTKPAIPGRVKTRLAVSIGADRAAELHRAFVGDVVESLAGQEDFELQVSWALRSGEEPPTWPETRRLRWSTQRGENLGARLFFALSQASEERHPVAAIGSDHPELDAATIRRAFQALDDADVAIGPAHDGGYYLIALRPGAVQKRLFEEIEWSTESVFEQTLERAAELNLRVHELPMGHDIDRETDLRALAARLEGGGALCPRTRLCLQDLGWLGGEANVATVGAGCES